MKNKLIVLGIIALLTIGIASVFVIGSSDKFHKKWIGIHKNFDKSVWLEKLGLSEDASEEEIWEAKKSKLEERHFNIIEKLGLPEDASDEEVQAALEEWKENKNFFHKGFHNSKT